MAYSALISLARTLEEIPQPVQQHITSLKEKVDCLLEILEKHSEENMLAINHLEAQIRDASFEAEDIIESQISRQRVVPSKSTSRGVLSCCFWEIISALEDMIPGTDICERPVEYVVLQDVDMEFQGLEKVLNEFDSILDAVSAVEKGEVEDLQPGIAFASSSSGFVASDESTVVGLDEDLLKIKDWLTGLPSNLDIISIVGMGGVGKTTLAKSLYNDPLIEHHFDTRAWIVVSQEYHIQEMFNGLLEHSTRNDGLELNQKSIEQLAVLLHRSLTGRRYLIVMDDVWDTKAWDAVRRYFPDNNNGSRIILTTRLSEVASYTNSGSSIHHMSLLNSEASWDLLRKKVFGKESCPSALEKIGKEIANSCKGLPLAIIVIGSLLSTSNGTRSHWRYIAKHIRSIVTGNDNQLMEILSLSYNLLPHHLKACFLYMGVFPEDYVIFVSQLIKLWIAEGFIKSVTDKSFEEVAGDYLNDLINRSLVMVHKRNHNGGIKTCIVHDLLRELCLKKAEDEKFLQIMNQHIQVFPQGKNNQRRASIHPSTRLFFLTNVQESYVRSLICFDEHFLHNRLTSFIMSSRMLRVLDALGIIFPRFPSQMGELVHLRYLGFAYWGNDQYLETICKLRNLQTLIICRATLQSLDLCRPIYLPSTIWEMPQLRHLWFDKSFLPYPIPTKIRGEGSYLLENLQTLSQVTDFRCSKLVTEMMPNLMKLGISYLYDSHTNWSSYGFKNFVYLHKLETLKLVFIAKTNPTTLPIDLAFPPTLRRLTLSGCRISWEKMTVVGSLPYLEVLKLKSYAFSGSMWEPNEGEFSALKFLLIDGSDFNHWSVNETHFPRLQHLRLRWCPDLVEIPSEIGEISTLQILELYDCSHSAVASARRIQEEQQDLGNNLRVLVNSYQDDRNSRKNTSLRKVHRGYYIEKAFMASEMLNDALRTPW